ncbi:hypothetical protein AGOR_G00172180 [Albula goreensis]|uniref:Ig-like domain-containing protein n=1 Tax=Albula goreensis TaxID=1534307 RepID=A0A8T3CZG0_9TELE|nr:hypothetical protein AGOR_G00172180 [Albula goreensis]
MGVASFTVALVITAVLPPGLLQDSRRAILSVDPPGPSFYVGEMVSLRCGVRGDLLGNWTFRWYRGSPQTPLPGASGDRYTIAGAHLGTRGHSGARGEDE